MANNNSSPAWPGWETVRLIGRGSFGAVYEIERDVFGHKEKAAMKLISIPQSDSDIEELYDSGYDEASVTATFKSHLERIVNEYSLMREMNGAANVVNCDDFRFLPHEEGIGWDIFIKMELLTPLTKALDRQPSDSQVIRIAKDMCNALILCRKYGIIHRDIKPQNIFVSKNGDYKLGDFGIAKTIEKTSGGTKIGTYKYMAPEVYNNQPYNHTADIYSLGLVLHWMLNERRSPFMPLPPAPAIATEEDEARAKRLSGTPIPPPAHGSAELQRIVLKACAYDSKDRYQSAEEMLRDLEAIKPEISSTTEKEGDGPAEEGIFGDQTKSSERAYSDADGSPRSVEEEDQTFGAFSPKESKSVENNSPAAVVGNKPNETEDEKTISAFQPQERGAEPDSPVRAEKKQKTRRTGLAVGAAAILLAAVICGLWFKGEHKKNAVPAVTALIPEIASVTDNPAAAETEKPAITPAPTPSLIPSQISAKLTMGTGGEAGTYYAYGGVLSSYIGANSGISINVVSSGGSAANLSGIVADRIYDLAIVSSDVMAYAYRGINSFTGSKMDGFRALGALYDEHVQIVTCNPYIVSVADLAGKKVCVGAVGSGTYFSAVDILAAYDLTINDITAVYQSFGESTESLTNGEIDAAILIAGAPTIPLVNLASANSVYLVSFDDEHMKKLLADCPWYASSFIPSGTYHGIHQDIYTAAVKVSLACRADLDDDVSYAIVSTIYNNSEAISALHAKGAELSLDSAVEGISIPFSGGAARFYAENGIVAAASD